MNRVNRTSELVIAIDFGTTYSGIAFSLSTPVAAIDGLDVSILAGDIKVERQWPNPMLQYLEKTPTILSYHTTPPKWGGSVKPQHNLQISHFKLGLEASVLSHYGSQALHSPYGFGKHPGLPNKEPVDFATDFLTSICKHLHKVCLPREFGNEFLLNQQITYVITIPAIWSDHAKALTRRAASQAVGVPDDKLILVPEPEAAALFCATMCTEVDLKSGDCLLVCDAGGGTVVLTNY